MNNQVEERIKEVAERMQQGIGTAAIIEELVPKWSVSQRTVERYIALAKDMLAGDIEEREAIVQSVRQEIIAEEAGKWLRSNMELEARLCAIISGDAWIEEEVITKDGHLKTVKKYPSFKDIIHAIDKLWKIRGVYRMAKAKSKAEEEDDDDDDDDSFEAWYEDYIAQNGSIADRYHEVDSGESLHGKTDSEVDSGESLHGKTDSEVDSGESLHSKTDSEGDTNATLQDSTDTGTDSTDKGTDITENKVDPNTDKDSKENGDENVGETKP